MKVRMSSDSFDKLYGMLRRGVVKKSRRLGVKTRNGNIPPLLALPEALRWLAGGNVDEVMERARGNGISRCGEVGCLQYARVSIF